MPRHAPGSGEELPERLERRLPERGRTGDRVHHERLRAVEVRPGEASDGVLPVLSDTADVAVWSKRRFEPLYRAAGRHPEAQERPRPSTHRIADEPSADRGDLQESG